MFDLGGWKSVTGPFTLVAFIVAAYFFFKLAKDRNLRKSLESADTNQAEVLALIEDKYKLDTENLTRAQRFDLAKTTLAHGHKQKMAMFVLIAFLALTALALFIFVPDPGPPPSDPLEAEFTDAISLVRDAETIPEAQALFNRFNGHVEAWGVEELAKRITEYASTYFNLVGEQDCEATFQRLANFVKLIEEMKLAETGSVKSFYSKLSVKLKDLASSCGDFGAMLVDDQTSYSLYQQ